MTPLFFLVLSWMGHLDPGREHGAAAGAIAEVVAEEEPLFAGDDARVRTAALLTAIAFRESRFDNRAVSSTNDHCMMQVNKRSELTKNVRACVSVAVRMLRESMDACPRAPLSVYATGACGNARGARISRDRMAIAAKLAQ